MVKAQYADGRFYKVKKDQEREKEVIEVGGLAIMQKSLLQSLQSW